jgi:hypothetical protein
VFVGKYNITLSLENFLSSTRAHISRVGVSGSDFARKSSANQFPCYRDLIPLLFRCYSAVNSAVNSALFPHSRDVSHRKYLNRRIFSTQIFAKTAASNIFSLLTAEFGFPTDPESIHGEPPRRRGRDRSMLKKTRIMPAAAVASAGLVRGRHHGRRFRFSCFWASPN